MGCTFFTFFPKKPFNPNSFNLVFYQHALQLCLCLLLGLLCSSRRVTELGLNILCRYMLYNDIFIHYTPTWNTFVWLSLGLVLSIHDIYQMPQLKRNEMFSDLVLIEL